MKNILVILVMAIGVGVFGQTAPTGGKKVLKVETKFIGEYNLDVYNSFSSAPYKYHMKKLPKKLLKYGFTNVQITALGSVTTGEAKRPDIGVAIAYARAGYVDVAVSKATTSVTPNEFQVNFDSDQGSFKVRLSMTATGIKYIIKES